MCVCFFVCVWGGVGYLVRRVGGAFLGLASAGAAAAGRARARGAHDVPPETHQVVVNAEAQRRGRELGAREGLRGDAGRQVEAARHDFHGLFVCLGGAGERERARGGQGPSEKPTRVCGVSGHRAKSPHACARCYWGARAGLIDAPARAGPPWLLRAWKARGSEARARVVSGRRSKKVARGVFFWCVALVPRCVRAGGEGGDRGRGGLMECASWFCCWSETKEAIGG